MKNIMIKSKEMTEALQAENLNVVDAMTIIMATVESLKRINDDEKAMDDEIQAGIVLQSPLKQPNLEDISELVKLFPSKMSVDSVVLQAEFHNFVSYVDLTKTKLESQAETAKFSEVCKSAFPLTNRAFRLLITAPVTVAQDERTFSRLKVIKMYLRTAMTVARLELLMLLSCEKDLTDSINMDRISSRWVELKSRRISAH